MRRCRVDFAARGSTLFRMVRMAKEWVHVFASPERRDLQRPLRVLVADDDRETVETLEALLQAQGHVVHSVYTGKDVLPAARVFRPDAATLWRKPSASHSPTCDGRSSSPGRACGSSSPSAGAVASR